MKVKRPWSLKAQLAAAMVGAVILSVSFGYFGLNFIDQWRYEQWVAAMPPAAKSAHNKLENDILPTQSEFDEYNRMYPSSDLRGEDVSFANQALLVLTLFAMSASLSIGLIIANTIIRPIEEIGKTVRAVAQGDLSARATALANAPREVTALLEDCNGMAEALEAFDREARESSAAIAHELRTPLTILRARLQAHYDGVFPWSNTGAKLLIDQVDALAHIIDDLQIVSLGATGQLALNQAPHDLSVLVASLVEGLGTSYALDDFKVETDLQVAIASIDPQRTRQLVLALAENARRHAKAGGLVRFETGVQGNQAVIKVLDRGPGLPVGHEQKIFERFWRADSSRDRVSGGSGLGLSVVSSLTKAQGGTVTAYNQKHGGAAFVVKFKAIK
jgi:two-component system sensor histidine kinase BaeS/two-component system sensor histidine kinase AdeS